MDLEGLFPGLLNDNNKIEQVDVGLCKTKYMEDKETLMFAAITSEGMLLISSPDLYKCVPDTEKQNKNDDKKSFRLKVSDRNNGPMMKA